jgi:hypothetical protein
MNIPQMLHEETVVVSLLCFDRTRADGLAPIGSTGVTTDSANADLSTRYQMVLERLR